MKCPDDSVHQPLAAGLFGLQHGAQSKARNSVPTETASAFARLFASSEAGDSASPFRETPEDCFA